MSEAYPYRKKDSQPKSVSWQLTPAVSYLVMDDGLSSLHFHWNIRDVGDSLRTGKLPLEDVKNAVHEIVLAIKSFEDLNKRDDFSVPTSLIINTPNLFLRKFFPNEYIVEKFGMEVFSVDIGQYMEKNALIDRKTAWVHFMENKVLPNLLEIQERLKKLEGRKSAQ